MQIPRVSVEGLLKSVLYLTYCQQAHPHSYDAYDRAANSVEQVCKPPVDLHVAPTEELDEGETAPGEVERHAMDCHCAATVRVSSVLVGYLHSLRRRVQLQREVADVIEVVRELAALECIHHLHGFGPSI